MQHGLLPILRETLQSIVCLEPEAGIEPLQEQCKHWQTWLDAPQTVLKVVAAAPVSATWYFREALTVLEQGGEKLSVTKGDTKAAADFVLYATMASAPWREDELELLASHADDAPRCILLLLEAGALDEEEKADTVDFAGRVLRSRLGGSQQILGVVTSAEEVIPLVQSQQASVQQRADYLLARLRSLLPQQIEHLEVQKKALAQDIAQKQYDYAQWKQQCDNLLRQLLVAENTAEAHIAKIVAWVHKKLRAEIMSLQRQYRWRCRGSEILNIAEDVTEGLKSDMKNALEKARQVLSRRLVDWFNEQTASISQMRQKCGLPPIDVDADDWLLIPSTVMPEPTAPFPQLVPTPFSRAREVIVGLLSGMFIARFIPSLSLPAGIAMWLGLDAEQRRREADSYRAQLIHWIDDAFVEAEKSFGLYLEDVRDEVVEAVKEVYRALHEETSKSIQHHLLNHPLLSSMKSQHAQLGRIQTVTDTLRKHLERLDAYGTPVTQ